MPVYGIAPEEPNMSLALDHLFVMVPPDGRAVAAAEAAGLVETHARVHRGQGTANACYGFDNAYLELLWRHDERELASAAVGRTGLEPRSRWWETHACPFGLCFSSAAPIPTWTYDVPFPPGMSAEMSETTADPTQPLLFFMSARGAAPPRGRQPLGASIRVTELQMTATCHPQVRLALEHAGIRVTAGPPLATIEVAGATSGVDLRHAGAPVLLAPAR
jgi:hypothetical protein